jgi:succinate dehydrogenase / fumarate reductase cytochrome b subunit
MSRPRPLSPHLSVWRFQLPAIMSISHRISGVMLASGTVLLAVWLLALASGPQGFALVQGLFGHPLGQLVLFGYSVLLFYHGCNGVRHLGWDLGKGLTMPAVYRSGAAVLVLACLLTGALWAAVLL